MSISSTNIRVFVHWTEQTVFAGEDIECQITFKNIATGQQRTPVQTPITNGSASAERRKKTVLPPLRTNSGLSPRIPSSGRGHRTTLSLNVPAASIPTHTTFATTIGSPAKIPQDGGAHKRSVSIISLGASEGPVEEVANHGHLADRPRRVSRGHGRSASLQLIPRRQGVSGGLPSATVHQRSITHPSPSPLNAPLSTANLDSDRPSRHHTGSATAPGTPSLSDAPVMSRKGSTPMPHTFTFPAVSSHLADERPGEHTWGGSRISQDRVRLLSPRSREKYNGNPEKIPSMVRVLSPPSNAGTPRSSGEFYSLSNNSTETLASEYLPQQGSRFPGPAGHTRYPSNLVPTNHHHPSEVLMMGYAQLHGSFTLDASLISQTPFEEVKRKGAVGGQGGGVIGFETNKRNSGLLGGFGWGSFGESLGGFLGGGELSSIKDMQGSTGGSRSIPLLSTPQSILFVDLQLAPGESRSYNYSFKLPLGLPPTHRGKAIKISYKLMIGTQRPGGAKEQQVKSVDIPFRILGSINNHGELLGHNLQSPYIILRDQATVTSIEPVEGTMQSTMRLRATPVSKGPESTLEGFLSYADELLSTSCRHSGAGLLSPTEGSRSRRQSSLLEPNNAREAVNLAIMRSNVATDTRQSANRFEIARSGKRVAVVMLARPAYRLGETICAAVDFSDAEIPCYAFHASLETSEKVDASIALRSEASIFRVTRKIHAEYSESTLFARRVIFAPTIPVSATPEFITSGVSLEWRIRIEFVTPRLHGDRDTETGYADLLEEIAKDDRGVTFAAAEALDCESFEIAVPLRIYGAFVDSAERDSISCEGLVI